MVIKVQSGKPFTLRGMLLLAFWPMVNSIHITDEGKITAATDSVVGRVGKNGDV